MVGNKEKLALKNNIKCTENGVIFLGAWISTDPTTTLKFNYTEQVNRVRNILISGEYQCITLNGKNHVINV